ncbi:Stealth CR1 domain-containing protein [Bowmanella sp. JS7-9]|uniref:Stealth CR1 domain-containing protein n=1 Tax=Pseudobowmanella zhangzhouensis TaxID=1537679 RepID=A0ABW1XII5_9ALTE|nr:Stealth CR1 domain-containing protein [Bowmanella sp. JS7-9]
MSTPIDVVIFWVDGNDPVHRQKRQHYLADFELESAQNSEQSTDDKRFVQHDELKYCLRSIRQHAPWCRTIWLVTDQQVPGFLDPHKLALDGIELVDHRTLFTGVEQYLPTFNSRALAARVHHIPGLAERYLIGNDDVMLAGDVEESFFFVGDKPVIYADWRDESWPLTLWRQGILSGASLMGFDRSHFIEPSHGFLPFSKSQMALLEQQFPEQFLNNLRYRFRHESQMLVESLYNHYCLKHDLCELRDTTPMVHFSFQLCREGSQEKVAFLLELLHTGQRKMLCINEFASLTGRFSWVEDKISQFSGRPLCSELCD